MAVLVCAKHLAERAGGHLTRDAINIKLLIVMFLTSRLRKRLRWRPGAADTLIYNRTLYLNRTNLIVFIDNYRLSSLFVVYSLVHNYILKVKTFKKSHFNHFS